MSYLDKTEIRAGMWIQRADGDRTSAVYVSEVFESHGNPSIMAEWWTDYNPNTGKPGTRAQVFTLNPDALKHSGQWHILTEEEMKALSVRFGCPPQSPLVESKEAAWIANEILSSMAHEAGNEVWRLQMKHKYVPDREAAIAQAEEFKDLARRAQQRIKAEAIALYGGRNPKFPDCEYCREVSVFGGPGHEPSPFCRSGKRPHSTCDSCF